MTWYTAGSVSTTANSNKVNGNSTAWTNSGIRDGDMLLIGYNTESPRPFEIKSIDSPTQITLVNNFPVAVSNSAYVAIPMLGGDRTAITMDLATQVTKALKDNQSMQAVWQSFYSATGTITLTMPDGTGVTGSSFKKLTDDMSSKVNKSELGNAAFKNTGTSAGSVAAGDDARLGTIDNKSGGLVSSGIIASGGIMARTNVASEVNSASQPVSSATYTGGGSSLLERGRIGMHMGISATGIRVGQITVTQDGGGAKVMTFRQDTGDVTCPGAFTGGSDVRMKYDISSVNNALPAVLSWRGCTYKKLDGGSEVGLLAQDVEKDCPEAVINMGEWEFTNGLVVPDLKGLNVAGVSAAYHTEAIKKLFELVELAITDPSEALKQISSMKKSLDVKNQE